MSLLFSRFLNISGIMIRDLAVDLGTANTLVYMKYRGIILDEPSVVALFQKPGSKKKVIAIGAEAKKMMGKTPPNVQTIRPMQDGVIADFNIAEIMLRDFLIKTGAKKGLIRPRIVIAVPTGITAVEKRAVVDSAHRAGAGKVFLIEEPIAAAIGMGLAIEEPACNMVVDIGGGTTGVTVISLAGIVQTRSLRAAGDRMDAAISGYIKKRFNIQIGEKTAETIKKEIGNAIPERNEPLAMEIRGKDITNGIPVLLEIDDHMIYEAISELLESIVETIHQVLDITPPELSSDIVDRGIVLTGGVSLLKNLPLYMEKELGVPIRLAKEPLVSVVKGAGMALDYIGGKTEVLTSE